MGTHFSIDHARKACITAPPNLITETQKYAKHFDFLEKRVTFGVSRLCCEETVYALVNSFCQDFEKKARESLTNCLGKA